MYVGASRTLKEKHNLNKCLFLRHGYTGSGSPNTGVVSAVYAFGCQPMATTQRPHDDLEAQTVDRTSTQADTDGSQKPRETERDWEQSERDWGQSERVDSRRPEAEARRWFRPR